MESQPKVKFSHVVMAGVVSPYRCKYLTYGVEVFPDGLLLDGLPMREQKYGTDILGKNL